MAGTYDIQWANGASFQVFKLGSQITIVGSAKEDYKDLEVSFTNTSLEADPVVNAVTNDGYTIEITLTDGENQTRAVMVEWEDITTNPSTWMVFGEVFVGDPDGAGGFGGEQNSEPPPTPET